MLIYTDWIISEFLLFRVAKDFSEYAKKHGYGLHHMSFEVGQTRRGHRSFYRLTASGNRFFAGKVKKHNRVFIVRGKAVSYDDFIRAVGDESASFVEEPFRDCEKATVGFRENASVPNTEGLPNYIPVVLSEPIERPVSVSYILWNADTGEEICRGVLDFDPYQCEIEIYIGEDGINVLAELTEGRGILPGERLIHLQTAGKMEQEGGTSP